MTLYNSKHDAKRIAPMAYMDANLWGIFAMPVGLIICFTPFVIAWWLSARGK